LSDLLYLAGVFITVTSVVFGLRVALRRHINHLQAGADGFTDEAHHAFIEIIFTVKKKDRDPIAALNLAAQYFSWKDTQNGLEKFYRRNKYYEMIAIVGLISSLLLVGVQYLYNVILDARLLLVRDIFFFVALGLAIASGVIYLLSYRRVNQLEKMLGIGKPRSKH
jgi:hypothetical protein